MSISTALVEPQVRPSGSVKWPWWVVYGFDKSLTAWADAGAATPMTVTSTVTVATTVALQRHARGIKRPSL